MTMTAEERRDAYWKMRRIDEGDFFFVEEEPDAIVAHPGHPDQKVHGHGHFAGAGVHEQQVGDVYSPNGSAHLKMRLEEAGATLNAGKKPKMDKEMRALQIGVNNWTGGGSTENPGSFKRDIAGFYEGKQPVDNTAKVFLHTVLNAPRTDNVRSRGMRMGDHPDAQAFGDSLQVGHVVDIPMSSWSQGEPSSTSLSFAGGHSLNWLAGDRGPHIDAENMRVRAKNKPLVMTVRPGPKGTRGLNVAPLAGSYKKQDEWVTFGEMKVTKREERDGAVFVELESL